MAAAGHGLWTYLKAAFKSRWNLLALFAASAAGIIAGKPDVVLPAVAAGELLFLGLASTNASFQRVVNIRLQAAEQKETTQELGSRFDELYRGLDNAARQRFDELRQRCEVLRDLAGRRVEGAVESDVDQVARAHLSGVNRLLWVYLKLLHTRMTLERFFASVSPDEVDKLQKDAQRKLDAIPVDAKGIAEKKRKSLEDTLATLKARQENIRLAKENLEFVSLELDRIAAKLSGISELAVNRQDPELLTRDVDDVARSVEATEQAIGELQAFTGFTAQDAEAPEILQAARAQQRVAS